MRQVIGLCGKSGCGKDYVYANYLKPKGWLQVSFAWHFKADLIGKGAITFEEAFITKPPQVRTLLQMVGTELGRNVYGDKIWCDTLSTWMDIYEHHWGTNKFVIPDVRFVNEVATIQLDLGGQVVRISAPERSNSSTLDNTQRAHPSEAEMDGISDDEFDAILLNDEGDEDLEIQLWHMMQGFGYDY